MSTKKKLFLGLGIAGGAVLLTWLFSGSRRDRTRAFISKKAEEFKKASEKVKARSMSEQHYL